MSARRPLEVALLTAFALASFAANSILCRLALRPRSIDPATFTLVRLASGALVLGVLARSRGAGVSLRGSYAGALALVAYAVAFSFAYLELSAGVGALLLFGAVQVTMIGRGIAAGVRPSAAEAGGVLLALGGLVGLAAPGAALGSVWSALSMAGAGVAWGIYSLLGRGSSDPLADTARNFVRAVVVASPLVLYVALAGGHWTSSGVLLAVASGALASGVGYAVWYRALRDLSATRAAFLQLLVPVIAAALGVIALGEVVTARLLACGAAILLGVGVALVGKARQR